MYEYDEWVKIKKGEEGEERNQQREEEGEVE